MTASEDAVPSSLCCTINDIRAAAERIAGHAKLTPVLTSSTLDRLAGRRLHCKAEVFQRCGAFKARGALNAVLGLSEEEAARGVVTHSSGNHAAAVSFACSVRGIPAYIVVPSNTPQIKRDAVATYGGRLTVCEPTIDAREAACARIQRETGAVFVPPYNAAAVIAGQGTMALEFLQQVPELDAIIVPVSGGGMISGIAIAAKALKPSIKVLAAEPCGRTGDAADVAASKAAGQLVRLDKPQTICDGLEARLGDLTWPPVRDLVDRVIVVTEAEVLAAMRLIMERMKVVVEPSGAAGLAAALTAQFREGEEWKGLANVGVILCGGNVDFDARGFWDAWGVQPA